MPEGILIFGGNGCGKTTLGRELARLLGFAPVDIEAHYFEQAEIPYSRPRSREDCLALLLADIREKGNFVLSAVNGDMGGEINALYRCAVYMKAPLEVRLERIRRRAYLLYGDRVRRGGDMYRQELGILDFVASRSQEEIEAWAGTLPCPVPYVDAERPVRKRRGRWRRGSGRYFRTGKIGCAKGLDGGCPTRQTANPTVAGGKTNDRILVKQGTAVRSSLWAISAAADTPVESFRGLGISVQPIRGVNCRDFGLSPRRMGAEAGWGQRAGKAKNGRGRNPPIPSPAVLLDTAGRYRRRGLSVQLQNLAEDFSHPLLVPEAQGIHQLIALRRVVGGGLSGNQVAEQLFVGYIQPHNQPLKAFNRQIFLAPFHLADIGGMKSADFRQPFLAQMELYPAIAQPLPKCHTNIAHFYITQIYTINRVRTIKQAIDILCARIYTININKGTGCILDTGGRVKWTAIVLPAGTNEMACI